MEQHFFLSAKGYYFAISGEVDRDLLIRSGGRFFSGEDELIRHLSEKGIIEQDGGYAPIGLVCHPDGSWSDCDCREIWGPVDLGTMTIESYLIDYVL
jgi:hypothetical protein